MYTLQNIQDHISNCSVPPRSSVHYLVCFIFHALMSACLDMSNLIFQGKVRRFRKTGGVYMIPISHHRTSAIQTNSYQLYNSKGHTFNTYLKYMS